VRLFQRQSVSMYVIRIAYRNSNITEETGLHDLEIEPLQASVAAPEVPILEDVKFWDWLTQNFVSL
jgi:hypothetical protein